MGIFCDRRITRIDICFVGSLVLILSFLVVNILLQSLIVVYSIIVLVLLVFVWVTLKLKSEKEHFKDQWVIALLSTILYPLVDYFFETYLGVVSYLTEDFRIISTPIYVILYWIFGVLFLGYCYHPTYGLTGRTWLAGIATGILTALSGTLMENLFNAMGFYVNSGSSLMIGHVPAYVTLGYIPSFSLMPLYLRHKYLSGLLLFGITGINWFIFYCVFSLL